jgi:hypothetical protein
MDRDRTLTVHVEGDTDSDAEHLAWLSSDLRRDLLELDVEDVRPASRRSPSGAKGTAMEWAELIVTVAAAAPGLFPVIGGWLSRHKGCTLTLEAGGERLRIEGLEAAEQRKLLREWMERHGLA